MLFRKQRHGTGDDTIANRLLTEEKVRMFRLGFRAGGEGFVRCSYATSYDKIERLCAGLKDLYVNWIKIDHRQPALAIFYYED